MRLEDLTNAIEENVKSNTIVIGDRHTYLSNKRLCPKELSHDSNKTSTTSLGMFDYHLNRQKSIPNRRHSTDSQEYSGNNLINSNLFERYNDYNIMEKMLSTEEEEEDCMFMMSDHFAS